MDKLFSKISTQHISYNQKELNQLKSHYKIWSEELENYSKKHFKSTPSNVIKKAQLNSLSKALKRQSDEVAKQLTGEITGYINYTSDKVIQEAKSWAEQFGIKCGNGAYTSVNREVVNTIVSGRLYGTKGKGQDYLSSKIWGDVKGTTTIMEKIVAGGIAQDKSVYEIANTLANFVNPSVAKMWNLKDEDGKSIYPKKVEYSAQRLARTMSQHAYQRTVALACKRNPFVSKIRWVANGSRVCPLCEERNGKEYAIGNVPLDHPNGMCVMEPVMGYTDEEIQQQIIDWFYGNNTNPDIPEWMQELDATVDLDKIAKKVKEKIADGKVPIKKIEVVADKAIKSAQKAIKSSGASKFDREEWKRLLFEQREGEFNTTWFDEVNKLSSDEQAFLREYTGGSYEYLNSHLRFGKYTDETMDVNSRWYTVEEVATKLTNVIKKISTPNEIITRRGSDYNMLKNLKIDYSEANKKNLIGMVVEDKAFTSTSPISSGGFSGVYDYIIKVPQGSQAVYVAPISHYRNEKELLINSGAKYRIDDVQYEGGNVKRIFMTLVNLQN